MALNFRNGGEVLTGNETRQLVDTFEFPLRPVGENAEELPAIEARKKLSLRQLAKKTGHSISYLQQQLRKFGIDLEKGNIGVAPYGWDWTGKTLVENAKEQAVICEIVHLRSSGLGFQAIASNLNRQSISAKNGGKWWPVTVKSVIQRGTSLHR